MNDNAVSTVQAVLAETSWLSTPCPPEYLPALARDVLYALEQAGMPVVRLPSTAELVVAIRDASYGYWHSENTLGCDTRGLAPAKHVAKALLAAVAASPEQP